TFVSQRHWPNLAPQSSQQWTVQPRWFDKERVSVRRGLSNEVPWWALLAIQYADLLFLGGDLPFSVDPPDSNLGKSTIITGLTSLYFDVIFLHIQEGGTTFF
ncbi:unnamed protein product, partial [Ectocarpus sp. 12 AP-2014]